MPFLRTRRLLRRPSPAMLVALLALVIAMSGSAVAAVLVSSPDQLANAVVTNPKLAIDSVGGRALAEPSVNSDQLHDNAVTNPKLATGAVNGRVLADRSVSVSKLTDQSVTSKHLTSPVFSATIDADGSIRRSVGVNPSLTRRVDGLGAILYEVGFQHDVSNCSAVATADTGMVTASASSGPPNVIHVILTRPRIDTQSGPTPTVIPRFVEDRFNLIVQC